MISWIIGVTTASIDDASGRTPSKRLVILLIISLNIYVQVSSSGVFQLKLTSFQNDNGYDQRGNCCHGEPEMEKCHSPCRTFFWVCLRHFQHIIPSNDVQCTYGQTTTAVLGQNTFSASQNDSIYLVNLPFDFTWPRAFSLIIEAWHDSTGIGPYEGSNRTLISRLAIKRHLDVGEEWRQDLYVNRLSRLNYRYRVVCSDNYYGPGCSEMCTPRDDMFGHYTCSQNASRVCRPGWTGEYCQTAICLDGCNATNGFCDEPFECKCRLGWQGPLCAKCITYPGCLHGGCSDRWQCNCFEGWGGLFCNQDLNFCTNNEPCMNGATCRNTGEGSYTCVCPPGFSGTNCEIEIFNCHRNRCLNEGTCQHIKGQYLCDCAEGFSGRKCETSARSCQDEPCKNGGNCQPVADGPRGYRCDCPLGFIGLNCEVDIDECDSTPCLNGGRCIDEHGSYRCVCPAGYAGHKCENDSNDCLQNPCLNGGSCIDGVNHFLCRCSAGFTGDLCQHNVDDCLIHPCANGGTCHDRNNGFACLCAPGFTGRDCSVKIDECQSRPCVRGTCQDLLNGYRCLCDTGFTGTHCNKRSNDTFLWTVTTTDREETASTDTQPDMEIPTGSDVRQTVLIVFLSVLLTLLALSAAAIVIFVFHRRHRARMAAMLSPMAGKMNNAEVREEGGKSDKIKDEIDLELLRHQQQQQQQLCEKRADASVALYKLQLQRNINQVNNIKNVEKCPARKQCGFAWDTTSVSTGSTAKTPEMEKHLDNTESRPNNQTMEIKKWKQREGLLALKGAPNAAVAGSVCYVHQDPTKTGEATLATEV